MNVFWWQKEVIYQIYPRSFCDSNNDGIGDIKGIISKLDYLHDLGVGAIWLSPLYKSPNDDFGYDISDYYSINPEYGTLEDMKLLFEEARKRHIRIIMDLVVNHTSDEHQWFVKGINPNSKYHDYYIWKEGTISKKGVSKPPNNWQSHFTGSAWSKNSSNNKYYLHLFSPKQPDLNYHNPEVINEIKNIMRFWLDLGAAGFRCDVINMIYKSSFKNGRFRLFNVGEEYYLSQPGSHEILKQFHRDVLKPYGAFTVGETARIKKEDARAYVEDELSTLFQFEHTQVDQLLVPIFKIKYRPHKMKKVLLKWQQILPWNAIYFENHDMPRSINRFGDVGKHYDRSAKMIATLLLTIRGTSFIYQGQEIGMSNGNFTNYDDFHDIASKNVYKKLIATHLPSLLALKLTNNFNRDHARLPIAWTNINNGGFTKGIPWIQPFPLYKERNVKNSLLDNNSILNYYKKLIQLRKVYSCLQYGNFNPLELGKNIIAYYRELDNQTVLIVINLANKSATLSKPIEGEILISNIDTNKKIRLSRLKPYQALLIIEKKSI
jgi:oligo-1,6-glucosidase